MTAFARTAPAPETLIRSLPFVANLPKLCWLVDPLAFGCSVTTTPFALVVLRLFSRADLRYSSWGRPIEFLSLSLAPASPAWAGAGPLGSLGGQPTRAPARTRCRRHRRRCPARGDPGP